MTADVPPRAREHLDEAGRILDGLLSGLDDESKPASERMASVAVAGAEVERCLQAALGEGLSQDHPALAEVLAKGDAIGPRLQVLSAAAASEATARAAPGPSEALGREAARLEERCFASVVESLSPRPEAAAVLARVRALRDEGIRSLWEVGQRRATLDEAGRRDFRWGLANARRDARELRERIAGELWRHYRDTPVREVLEEIHGLIGYLDAEGLSGPRRAHLERLGLR